LGGSYFSIPASPVDLLSLNRVDLDPQSVFYFIIPFNCRMGFAGDTWPYFRPNFESVEKLRQQLNEEIENAKASATAAAAVIASTSVAFEPLKFPSSPQSSPSSSVLLREAACVGQPENDDKNRSRCPLSIRTAPMDAVLAFIPTGWAASSNYNVKNSKAVKGDITVQLVSNFIEFHATNGELMFSF
jgi:hypothetical protein